MEVERLTVHYEVDAIDWATDRWASNSKSKRSDLNVTKIGTYLPAD